jgi:hypothetical protein
MVASPISKAALMKGFSIESAIYVAHTIIRTRSKLVRFGSMVHKVGRHGMWTNLSKRTRENDKQMFACLDSRADAVASFRRSLSYQRIFFTATEYHLSILVCKLMHVLQ